MKRGWGDPRYLKLICFLGQYKTCLIMWVKTSPCFSLTLMWNGALWTSVLQFKFHEHLTGKCVMLLLLAPGLWGTKGEQLRWTSWAFLLSRGADSSGGSEFETENYRIRIFLLFNVLWLSMHRCRWKSTLSFWYPIQLPNKTAFAC